MPVGKWKALYSAWRGNHARSRAPGLPPLYDGTGFYSIAEIMQGIKSTSAHRINQLLSREGKVWQNESFDHVVRREENIVQKVEYMMQNPVRAGLVSASEKYLWAWFAEDAARARTLAPTSIYPANVIKITT
jgi:hypothetical protein